MSISPVIETQCQFCETTCVQAATRIPICDACREAKRPATECYLVVGFEGPIEDARAHAERGDAYRRWLCDPNLDAMPDGTVVYAEAATLGEAFTLGGERGAILGCRKGWDDEDLEPLAICHQLPIPVPKDPPPMQAVIEPRLEVTPHPPREDLESRLARAVELRKATEMQCERLRQWWLQEKARATMLEALARHAVAKEYGPIPWQDRVVRALDTLDDAPALAELQEKLRD